MGPFTTWIAYRRGVNVGAPIGASVAYSAAYTTGPICTPQAIENRPFSQGNEGLCRLTEVAVLATSQRKMPLVGLEPTTR